MPEWRNRPTLISHRLPIAADTASCLPSTTGGRTSRLIRKTTGRQLARQMSARGGVSCPRPRKADSISPPPPPAPLSSITYACVRPFDTSRLRTILALFSRRRACLRKISNLPQRHRMGAKERRRGAMRNNTDVDGDLVSLGDIGYRRNDDAVVAHL
uniref:Uncharacterized protein n=1 Tax=Plectus sambesii TaxID=2011161 RepID=A0A914V8H8_9BILA